MRVSFTMITCLLAAGTLFSAGCKGPESKPFDPSAAQSSLPPKATLQAGIMLQQYFLLKNALVKEQKDTAVRAAGAMKAAVSAFRTITGYNVQPAQTDSLYKATDTLLTQLDAILASKDAGCETQRLYFKPVSAAMYQLLRLTGMRNIMTYRQYCPMAFNEQGAYWLSREPAVENPYFGAKMLTCGELIDTIR